jgi:hypothetical protein
MNNIRNDLPEDTKLFFKKISEFLDTNLYFYGSVTRADYVPNKSDIDVAIFTDNEKSTIFKLQHVLQVDKKDFHKLVWKMDGTMIYGYKIQLEDMNTEICIYNNEFKHILIEEFRKPLNNQPFYIYMLLYLLKLCYYHIPLLSKETYVEYKRYILNEMMGHKESVFYVLKPDA